MKIWGFTGGMAAKKEEALSIEKRGSLGIAMDNVGCAAHGTAFYRVLQPLQFLHQKADHEVHVDVTFGRTLSQKGRIMAVDIPYEILDIADLLLFHQQRLWHPDIAADLIGWKRVFEGVRAPLIYDCDDNYHFVAKSGSPETMYRDPATLRDIERFIELCDCLTVTTEELKRAYSKFGPKVAVVPNMIHVKLLQEIKQKYSKPHEEIVIGWAGSISHRWDLEPLIPVVNRITQEFPHVQFTFVGYIPPELEGKPQINYVKGTWESKFPVTAYYGRVAQAGFDIAMIPIIQSTFNKYKSPLKFLEMGAMNIPCIVDNALPYSPYISHGNREWCLKVNAKSYEWNRFTEKLLASDELGMYQEEWYQNLVRLIQSETLRKQLGAASFEFVSRYFDMENGWQLYDRLYQKLIDIKKKYYTESEMPVCQAQN